MTTDKSTKINKRLLKQIVPYVIALVAIMAVVFVGSLSKNNAESNNNISMSTMSKNNYQVSTDQLSEMYVVASLSSSMQLASTDTVSNNYVIVSVMHGIGQNSTSTDKIEKPSIVDTSNICQGICIHTVADGETMESIAAKYGLTTDQIRWSNDLKNTDVKVGQQLLVTGVPGIVHVVKSGETPESIAEKYESIASDIEALNSNLAVGAQIVIPNGVLPANERPERTVVASTYSRNVATYTYYGSSSGREDLRVLYGYNTAGFYDGNPMVRGNCTWFAWGWRNAHGSPMPGGGALGNAYSWASVATSYGYAVNHTPAYGAVFQTGAGYYGHVGIVTAVNSDGSITVQEMNYAGYNVITESTIPANQVGNFYYIH